MPGGTIMFTGILGNATQNDYDLFSAGPDRAPDTPDEEWGR